MAGRHVGGLVLIFALLPTAAQAEPSVNATPAPTRSAGLRLEWLGPQGCPKRDEVLAHVATLAAADRLRWERFEVIRGAIARAGSRWSLTLEFVGSDGVRKRTLDSVHCGELAEAAAVAIVLAHRAGEAESSSDGPANADTVSPASTPAAAPAAIPETAPALAHATTDGLPPTALTAPARDDVEPSLAAASSESVPVALAANAAAALDPTSLGSAAFGAELGLELRWGSLSTALYGTVFPSASTRLGVGQSVALGLWAGGLRGCYLWGRGLDTCGLLELGSVSAKGVGLTEASHSRDLWATPGLSAGFTSTPFDGFGLTTRLSAFHPLVRGSYRVDDSDIVHRIPTIGFRAEVGLTLPVL